MRARDSTIVPAWNIPTPDRCVVLLLGSELSLFGVHWFEWFAFSRQKGLAVLSAVAVYLCAVVALAIWAVIARLLRRSFRFSLGSLMILVLAAAVPLGWLSSEFRAAKAQAAVRHSPPWNMSIDTNEWYDPENTDPPEHPAYRVQLEKLLGEDFFVDVTHVTVRGKAPTPNEMTSALSAFAKLQSLTLNDSTFTDEHLQAVPALSHLEALNVRECNLTDEGLVRLERFRNLRAFFARETKINGQGLAALHKCRRLESLDLSRSKVSDDGLAGIAGMTSLRTVDLSFTKVGDAGMKHLARCPNLREINLWHTQVTGHGLRELAALPKLEALSAWDLSAGDEAVERLADVPTLKRLYLGAGNLTDNGARRLVRMKQLTNLDIGGPGVTDAGIANLCQLTQLTQLGLRRTRLTDAGVRHIIKLPRLLVLNIAGTQVGDDGLAQLKTLHLDSLEIEGQHLADEGLAVLVEFPNLRSLTIRNLRVTPETIKHLSKLPKLLHLGLEPTAETYDWARSQAFRLSNSQIIAPQEQ